MDKTLLILLVAFQLKHFFADYPLQNEYMLGKFKEKGWLEPLLAHSMIHALMTFGIAFLATSNPAMSTMVSLLDLLVHGTMDRIKAAPDMLGRFKPMTAQQYKSIAEAKKLGERLSARDKEIIKHNKYFWWSLGLDQGVHHLTHYVIIAILLTN